MYKNIQKQTALKLKELVGGDAMVTVLEGTGRFTVGGEVFHLSEGETLVMPKDIPHAVYGETRFKMQLTVSY